MNGGRRVAARNRAGASISVRAVPGSDEVFHSEKNGRTYHRRRFLVPDPYAIGREIEVKATWDGRRWVVADRVQAHDYGNEMAKFIEDGPPGEAS